MMSWHRYLPKKGKVIFASIIRPYLDRHVIAIGCIAYANGLPGLLTASTLGVWLHSYGFNYTSIGLFGLLHIPYAVKFLWAPLLDHYSLPFLKKRLGQRRSWLCLVQVTAIAGLLGMSTLHPLHQLKAFVACGFLVTISAASQHVLLLTYQIETLHSRDWGVGEGMSVFAFRMAMQTAGAGALALAAIFAWQEVYLFITLLMSIGLFAVLFMREPDRFALQHTHSFADRREWLRYAIIGPFKDFMTQKGWGAILVFMVIYRLPEQLLISQEKLFLIHLGFQYTEISMLKTFGIGTSIFGSILGGYWIRTYGYRATLLWGGIAYGISCLFLFMQARGGATLPFLHLTLYLTIGLEHFLSGITLTAFFSYQLTCVSIAFAATQLALLTSIHNLSGVLPKPLEGLILDTYGWEAYLALVVLSAIPGVLWVRRIPFSRP